MCIQVIDFNISKSGNKVWIYDLFHFYLGLFL